VVRGPPLSTSGPQPSAWWSSGQGLTFIWFWDKSKQRDKFWELFNLLLISITRKQLDNSTTQIICQCTISLYKFIFYRVIYYGLLDQPQCASGTIFSGGPRTKTKFTKSSLSLKRLRTSVLEAITRVILRAPYERSHTHIHQCGAWWRIDRDNASWPEGHGFESRSIRHVGTLGKSFTRSCLWRLRV